MLDLEKPLLWTWKPTWSSSEALALAVTYSVDRPASSHLVLCSMKPWYLLRPIHTSDRIDGTVDLSWFCSFAGHFSYSTKEQAPSGGEERWLHFFNYNLYSYRSEAIDSISCTFVMRSEQVSRIGLAAFPLINSICKIWGFAAIWDRSFNFIDPPLETKKSKVFAVAGFHFVFKRRLKNANSP